MTLTFISDVPGASIILGPHENICPAYKTLSIGVIKTKK